MSSFCTLMNGQTVWKYLYVCTKELCCGSVAICNVIIEKHLQLNPVDVKLCLIINVFTRFLITVCDRPTTVQSCETLQNDTGDEQAPVGTRMVLTQIWCCSIFSAQSSKPQSRLCAQSGPVWSHNSIKKIKNKIDTYPV